MRRALSGGILTLFLLAPFATQAEAAEAFALSLAEIVHPQVIEPDDFSGDHGHGLTDASVRVKTESAWHAPDRHTLQIDGHASRTTSRGLIFESLSRRREDPPWPSPLRSRRLALLQVFLR